MSAAEDLMECVESGCYEPVDPADAACCTTNNLCQTHARDCRCWPCATFHAEAAAAEPLEDR